MKSLLKCINESNFDLNESDRRIIFLFCIYLDDNPLFKKQLLDHAKKNSNDFYELSKIKPDDIDDFKDTFEEELHHEMY